MRSLAGQDGAVHKGQRREETAMGEWADRDKGHSAREISGYQEGRAVTESGF